MSIADSSAHRVSALLCALSSQFLTPICSLLSGDDLSLGLLSMKWTHLLAPLTERGEKVSGGQGGRDQ